MVKIIWIWICEYVANNPGVLICTAEEFEQICVKIDFTMQSRRIGPNLKSYFYNPARVLARIQKLPAQNGPLEP